MPSPLTIGLLLHQGSGYCSHFFRIFAGHAAVKGWNLQVSFTDEGCLETFRPQVCDGIITAVYSSRLLKYVEELPDSIPLVSISGRYTMQPKRHVKVGTNNQEIVARAVEHLTTLGRTTMIWVGDLSAGFSRERAKAYQSIMKERREVQLVIDWPYHQMQEQSQSILKTIKDFNSPIGVICSRDTYSLFLENACLAEGLSVPEDVAIIGVDDDKLICPHASIPLSTVPHNYEDLATTAAEQIEKMAKGSPAEKPLILVPPGDVVIRESTSMPVNRDPLIDDALRWLRKYAFTDNAIEQTAKGLGVSRRLLELRIRHTLNTTPKKEVMKIRLAKSRELLITSNDTIDEIATACGFASPQVYSRNFKISSGMTPLQFRRINS